MKLIITSLAILFLIACGGKSGQKEKPAADSINQSTTTPAINNADTLVIDKNAVVFYNPDSSQLEKWKKEVGEKDFETVADDWANYMNTSSEYLKTTNLPVLDASDKKVLKFVKADHSVTMVRLDTLSNYWGMYLFSPAKEPQYADIIMMEESYKKYFK